MAKPATAIFLAMALAALLSITLHLQVQAAMEGSASVQDPSRPEHVAVALNTTNLVCRSCNCCVTLGEKPEVCYTRCCFSQSQSQLFACGCASCGGN
ncbi:hypothetical protein EJB05_36666 [Eragrostis curvula]|uniref:Bowman-Birk serine protease inhibitors family domain-containing protein n=1 Tax=Eragrostis curvula TaxID=38414 RepID=A0A5J9UBC6_9POAL|nr:hypothetical protein EJB05_36666 [Eragrostis curvula]